MTKNTSENVAIYNGLETAFPVFVASTLVNSPLSIWKDRFIAMLYGDTPTAFPGRSYGCFIVRDAIVIGVSFTVSIIVIVILLTC